MTIFTKKSCVTLRSSSGSGLVSGNGVAVSMLMVGRIFLNSCFKWPFVVAGERGRCLDMSSSVRPGQVERWIFLIALTNVEGAGLKHVDVGIGSIIFWSCSFGQRH